jgi:hypothetical protein
VPLDAHKRETYSRNSFDFDERLRFDACLSQKTFAFPAIIYSAGMFTTGF